MTYELLEMARVHDPSLDLKYNKFYIGLAKDGYREGKSYD